MGCRVETHALHSTHTHFSTKKSSDNTSEEKREKHKRQQYEQHGSNAKLCTDFTVQVAVNMKMPPFINKGTTHKLSVLQEKQGGGSVLHMTNDVRGRISLT